MSQLIGPAIEFFGILSIKAIIFQTNSGLPLYENKFTDMEIEAGLISGFSSALSSMFEDVNEEEKIGFETFQNKSMFITLHKSPNSTILLVSGDVLPNVILKQIEKSHTSIEDKFLSVIKDQKSGFVELPKSEIELICSQNGLKLLLADKIIIDVHRIQELSENEDINKIFRYYLSLILEFNTSSDQTDFIRIIKLVEFLRSKSISNNEIANTIFLAHGKDVFKLYS